MKAVILAAGRGTRMKHLTDFTPKPMIHVAGRPILEYTFDALPDEVTEVVVVVGYLQNAIRDYFGEQYKRFTVRYVVDEEINGTGLALMQTAPVLEGEEKFLVLNADDLYDKDDLTELVSHDWGILAAKVDDPTRFGVLKVDDEGKLVEIIEKPQEPPSDMVAAGGYVVGKEYFDEELVQIPGGEYGLPQTLQKMASEGRIALYVVASKFWVPVGRPEDIPVAEAALKEFYGNAR